MTVTDPHHPAAPAAKSRPSSVTISSYLLFLVALLFAIGAIAGLATLGTASDVYRDAYQGTDLEGTEAFVTVFGAVASVVQLLFGATFVVLALLNNRGRNVARIITWVLIVLGFCCTGLNLLGTAFSSMNTGTTTGNMPDPAEVQRRLDEALPGWVNPVNNISNVLALIALLAAAILLALPKSNEFFRKPQAVWEPPVPGATYPGQPPYPGQVSTGAGFPPAGAPGGYPPAGAPPVTPSGDPGYPPVPPPGNQPPGTQPSPGTGTQPSSGDQQEPPSGPPASPPTA